jgi:PBSX family phage terminase large subunit
VTQTLVHPIRPRGRALELFGRRDAEVVLSGPAGTGKSWACLHKVHLILLKNPGAKALAVRKTAVSLTSTGLQTYKDHVASEVLLSGDVRFHGGSQSEPASFRYSNGSRLVVGGMDKPTKIMSSEYDVIYVQEATELTLTDWEALTTRLRNGRVSFQQLIGDCNPDHPQHWLKHRADTGALTMLHTVHEENPVLFDDAGAVTAAGASYIARLDALTGVRHKRLRQGLWAAAEGIVFEDWDPAVHLVDRFPPKDWRRIWSVDFGFVNPFVCQMWAIGPDGQAVLYREYVKTKTIVEDHARELARLERNEPRPDYVICDHDAEDRATLERHLPHPTRPAHKNVKDGINAFAERLKAGRLHVRRNALAARDEGMDEALLPQGLAEEVGGYVWLPSSGDRPAKDEPEKRNDHSMDAARYLVADLDLGPRFRIRSFG